jgi:hypothetical protein
MAMITTKANTMPVVCRVSLRDGQTTRRVSSYDSREKPMKRLPGSENHAMTRPATRPPARMPIRASSDCSDSRLKPSTPPSATTVASVTSTTSSLPLTV